MEPNKEAEMNPELYGQLISDTGYRINRMEGTKLPLQQIILGKLHHAEDS